MGTQNLGLGQERSGRRYKRIRPSGKRAVGRLHVAGRGAVDHVQQPDSFGRRRAAGMAAARFIMLTARVGVEVHTVVSCVVRIARAGLAAAVLCLALSPADAAVRRRPHRQPVVALAPAAETGSIGSFTPATADPRLAAVLARGASMGDAFRFTPSSGPGHRRAVTVAIRARSTARLAQRGTAMEVASVPEASSVAPSAYNLGVAVSWQHFAFSSDIAHLDAGGLPGSRDLVDLGLSYGRGRWSTRLSLGADRSVDNPLPTSDRGYSLDLGESFAITRNLDLTGGVRYRTSRDAFETSADARHDSQSVYVGTAFRF